MKKQENITAAAMTVRTTPRRKEALKPCCSNALRGFERKSLSIWRRIFCCKSSSDILTPRLIWPGCYVAGPLKLGPRRKPAKAQPIATPSARSSRGGRTPKYTLDFRYSNLVLDLSDST